MDPCHLDHAPIVEALLDIRVVPEEGAGADLAAMRDLLGPDFQETKPRFHIIHRVDLGGGPPTVTREADGYAFPSTDGRRVVQVGPKGFTLSVLAPYKDWDELRDEARRCWLHFVTLAKPRLASRIGARFVNRIELPLPAELPDWFETYPVIGPSLPQTVVDHVIRLVIPLERGMGIITQLAQPVIDGTRLPIILDVDASLEAEFHPGTEPLWTAIEALRDAKNKLFFGSIKERTADLYR